MIVNTTIRNTETQKQEMKDLAQELGVNPNAFMSASSVYVSRNISRDIFTAVVNIMKETTDHETQSNIDGFFGNPKVVTPTTPPKKTDDK